jgi:hypothetical protein
MDMENIKKVVKESIVQNFMEAAKFARRGAEKQRPKSWSKGTKSGSDKRKMREQGKRDASEMQEGVSPFKRWELQQELKHEDDPNFERNMRQDAELARMDQNAKWSMQRLLPVYEKHGMAEEHAGRTDQYGFPSYGHAITHPNFTAFAKDFIAFHTAENKKHWAEKGKASSFHWPAILRAKEGLESLKRHDEYNAKQRGEQGEQSTGDLSEMYYNRLKEETNDIPRHAKVSGEEIYGAMDPHAEYRNQLPGNHPDNVRAEHRGNAMKELEQITQRTGDQSHANSTVARGAIAAALAHMRLSNSNDPTLRHIESILNGHQDAFDDHFKLSQQKSDVPF